MLKRELIKNGIIVSIILLIAIVSTYHIYYKFQNDRDVDFNSESLNVVFHDTAGDKISITKITPVTDSVGLSSNTYSLDVHNNLTVGVPYQIKIIPDLDMVDEDDCSDITIPEEDIRISVKVGKKDNEIYSLNELKDGILLTETVDALKTDSISIRVWINKDSTLLVGSKMHYHGIIQVIENEDIVAIKQVVWLDIDLSLLHSHTVDEVDISGEYMIPDDYYQNSDVVKLNSVQVSGKVTLDEEDNDHITCSILGSMIILDSISLEEVNYPFSIQYDDFCEENCKKSENLLDIFMFLWENIVLEVPLQFTKVDDLSKFHGDGWKLISEDEYHYQNNPFNELLKDYDKE